MTTYLYDTFAGSDSINNLCGDTDVSTGRYAEITDIIGSQGFGMTPAGHHANTGQLWGEISGADGNGGAYTVTSAAGSDLTFTCVVDHIVSLDIIITRAGGSAGWWRSDTGYLVAHGQDAINAYQMTDGVYLPTTAGAHTIVLTYNSTAHTANVTVDGSDAGTVNVNLGSSGNVVISIINDTVLSFDGFDPGHINTMQLDGTASGFTYEWTHHVACTETP